MSKKFRLAAAAGCAASAILIPAGTAYAHVHRVTPLNCIEEASDNAGADVAFVEAADEAGLVGVIPIAKGGNVTDGGSQAAVCDEEE